jgi:hypothetical protein
MRKKLLIISVLMLLFLLETSLPAFADERWVDPKTVESPYPGREYTRQHWTRFWVNETGYGKGTGGSEIIGQGYCSVFDLPGSLAEGYTAVMNQDKDVRLSIVRQKFLEAFNFDFDNAAQGYPCSPSWYKQYGDKALYISDQSGCQYDVPIIKTTGDSYTGWPGVSNPPYTINNPVCLKKGEPADVAGGWRDDKKWYWYAKKGNTYGEINLTKKAASGLYWDPSGKSTSADVIVAFPYGLSMIGLETTYLDPDQTEDTYTAYIHNTTPYKAVNVKFRAYELLSDGKMILIDERTGDIPAMNKINGNGVFQYVFTAPVQQSDYTVIATVNINAANGLGSGSVCEPLITQYAYGSLTGTYVHGAGGVTEKALYIPWEGRAMPNVNYNDNYQTQGMVGHTPTPKPPGPEPPAGENNLSVYDMHVYDAATGEDVTSPQVSQTLKVKASYKSTFSVGGWARLRFYRYEADYSKLTQIGDTINYYFGPNADITYDYDYGFNLGTGQYKIIASIDYYNNGNDLESNWQSEKFDGTHDEATYNDNKMVRDLTGSEAPHVPPTPVEISQSMWFPPVAIIELPGEPKEELKPIYGYRRVPLIKDEREVKKRVRLVE